jgi:hypothetical protein
MSHRIQVSLMSLVLLSAAWWLHAQDAASETDQERADRLSLMKQQAAAYTLTYAGGETKLQLHDDPVLRFSNPVSGVPDGIVAMWKDGKRPAVFAQVFQTKDGLWVHECQSLAAAGLSMTKGGTVFWQPKEGAEAFRRLEDATAPASTPGRRLVQMKDIASEFTAADDFKINTSDPEPTRHTLRLLTTPIYRYEDAEGGIQDGAVFAFVHGTDPEVFLVLESRLPAKGDVKDQIGWHYTLAPMTCWAVTVEHREKQVWSLPERLNKSKPGDLYHVWLHRTLRLPFMR